MDVYQTLAEAMSGRFLATADFWKQSLSGFAVQPVAHGVVLLHSGPEVHVAAIPSVRKRWFSRRLVREWLKPILDQYGHLTTSVSPSNPIGQKFVEGIGFERTGETESAISYRLVRLSHV